MKQIFSYSQKKFLSFSPKQQHKKCSELLRAFTKRKDPCLLQEYEKIASWMGLAIPCEIEERFHYHLRQADLIIQEHDFLRTARHGDKAAGKPWLSIHTYLDGLRSCHNVGSIVRTIEAFRLGPLHLSPDMMLCDHPLIRKVSMGSWQDVAMHHSTCFEFLPRPWIALETVDNSSAWNSFSYPETCTLFLGNEERGILPSILHQCDHVVTIPLYGKKNSLNVSNAFAILAAEVARQRHST